MPINFQVSNERLLACQEGPCLVKSFSIDTKQIFTRSLLRSGM